MCRSSCDGDYNITHIRQGRPETTPSRWLVRCGPMEPLPDEAPPGRIRWQPAHDRRRDPRCARVRRPGNSAPAESSRGRRIDRRRDPGGDRRAGRLDDRPPLRARPCATTLGNEEPGQVVVEAALAEIGLEPVDVPMDGRTPARPSARGSVRLDVAGKRNVVSRWGPRDGEPRRSLILNGHIDVRESRADDALGRRRSLRRPIGRTAGWSAGEPRT